MVDLKTNLLYFGDNLEWLRQPGRFPDESVDLVYLDPPFNSNRNYNVLFKESDVRDSEAQIHAFEDTWAWDREGRVQEVFNQFWLQGPDKPKQLLKSLIDALGHNDVTAYLTMMAPRLVELHRVLKPTGSLYLHCDPTASHYLKVVLDAIFRPDRFANEIIWKRYGAHNDVGQGSRHFGRVHDTLLVYNRGPRPTWNQQFTPLDPAYIESTYRFVDPETGKRFTTTPLTGPGGAAKGNPVYEFKGHTRAWRYAKTTMEQLDAQGRLYYSRTGYPRQKLYLDQSRGVPIQDAWTDIPSLSGAHSERLGYPTQKPLALLERIVAASSNEGDVVLDPFCGCGTAVHAAHKLGRRWIGIDITPLATDLIRRRLEDAFPGLEVPIEGWPVDMAGAIALASQADRYHFQDWAVLQAGGRPATGDRRSKKGADRGIDGVIAFIERGSIPKRGVISVKSGNTGARDVREVSGVLDRDPDVEFVVFICLYPPTRPMIEEALSHGTWESTFDQKSYPRVQILSAQDLIDGKAVRMPQAARSQLFAAAPSERKKAGRTRTLPDFE